MTAKYSQLTQQEPLKKGSPIEPVARFRTFQVKTNDLGKSGPYSLEGNLGENTMFKSANNVTRHAVPRTPLPNSTGPACFLSEESDWRLPHSGPEPVAGSRIRATRWRMLECSSRDCEAHAPADTHVVKVVLRNMHLHFAVDSRTIVDGLATPGMFHLTEPGSRATAVFRGPCDTVHIYIPAGLMDECTSDLAIKQASHSKMAMATDPIVESLARALVDTDVTQGDFSDLYVDCIGVALLARLLHATNQPDLSGRAKVAELPRWRLNRVIEFIDADLERNLNLADIAAAAGLSRMHFAAQFRAATGLRPHEYLLRRRIEKSQEMLGRTQQPIVDIALSVGFQTQSHFTTIFKRFTGQTPFAWRRALSTKTALS